MPHIPAEWIDDDPWGSWSAYSTWLQQHWTPANDSNLFWVTVGTRGTLYLALSIEHLMVNAIDFTKLEPRTLFSMMERGILTEDLIHRMGVPARRENRGLINYYEPLPDAYFTHLMEQEYPFESLQGDTELIIRGRLALEEVVRRGRAFFLLSDYIVSESPSLQTAMRERMPDVPLPDKNRAFERLLQEVEDKIYASKDDDGVADTLVSIYELLKGKISKGYDNPPVQQALPPMRPFDDAKESWEAYMEYSRQYDNEEGKRLDARLGSEAQAREMLLDIQAAAIDGKLPNYLATTAAHDRIDEERKNQSIAKHEVPLGSETDEHEVPKINPLDQLAYQQWFEEQERSPRLEDLNLPIDQLTPGEKRVLQEVLQAEELGYIRSSKTGKGYREFWGEDYGKKIKMLERAKVKIKTAMSTTGKSEQ